MVIISSNGTSQRQGWWERSIFRDCRYNPARRKAPGELPADRPLSIRIMLESNTRHLEASTAEDVPPRSWACIVAAAEAMSAHLFSNGSVALRVVSDPEIRALNKQFRSTDRVTDVLSFPNGAGQGGDIALSWDTTLRQAVANGNQPEEEACALIAHGLLHLAGYDHDTDESDARMQAATIDLLRHAQIEVSTFGH